MGAWGRLGSGCGGRERPREATRGCPVLPRADLWQGAPRPGARRHAALRRVVACAAAVVVLCAPASGAVLLLLPRMNCFENAR